MNGRNIDPLVIKRAIPIVIFLFALGFRLCGIGWGLKNDLHNASYHPDEPVIFANSRAIEPGLGQFAPKQEIPQFYSYGTLYLTLLRVASDVTTSYTGAPVEKKTGATRLDWDWVSRCHMAGRLISCLAGAGTALVVGLLFLKRVGAVAGAAAGLLVAFAPAHLMHSRFQTVDVLATFFVALSLYYSCEIGFRLPHGGSADEGKGGGGKKAPSVLKLAILSGAFAGLSAGTKYTGILALLSLVVALIVSERRKAGVPLLAGVAVAGLVFVITTPGMFLQSEAFARDIAYEMGHTATGHGLAFTGTGNGFSYTLLNLLIGIGPIPVLLGLFGLGYAAFKHHRWAWILLTFWIAYFLLIGRSEVRFVRYSFPLYVAIAAGFGYSMQVCHRKGGWSRVGVGVGILGLGGIPFGGLATSAAMTAGMMGEDPRDTAARYLKPLPGPLGLVHSPWFWTPPTFPDANDSLAVPLRVKMMAASTDSKPPISLVIDDSGAAPGWSTMLLDQMKPDLVSFSSFEYFPILRLKGQTDLGVQQAEVDSAKGFLDKLQSLYAIDKQFGHPDFGGGSPEFLPEDLLYTDPVIYVWKRKP